MACYANTHVARCLTLTAVCGFLSGVNAVMAIEQPLDVVGLASERSSGELLYREFHYCGEDGLVCLIEYRDPAGELLASKELDYRSSVHAPSVSVRDIRHSRQQTFEAQNEDGLVADAGFDNFVRSSWDVLSAGERVTFRFQAIGANKPYTMRVQRNDSQDCPAQNMCLTVEVDSWLLGLVAKPLELVYSEADRRLMRFSGVSNIRSEKDKAQEVNISYQYGDEEAFKAPHEFAR